MTNREIAGILRNIACAYILKDENKYRFQIIAYQRAADSIEQATSEVKDLWESGRLHILPGLGPSIAGHLAELFQKGFVPHFQEVLKGIPEAVFPLLEIPGFGPKKAYKLVKDLKIRNKETAVSQVEKAAGNHKICSLEGFGEKSEQDILRAVKEYRQSKEKSARMILPYAEEIALKIISYLKNCPFVERIDPLGSLRRMAATVGDIDIAVATGEPKKVVDFFVKYPGTKRIVKKGQSGATILISNMRQIDLKLVKPEAYGALLSHFTGSKAHNIHLREYGLSRGFSLSEYGIKIIKKKSNKIKFSKEKDFYQFLGLSWIPPELREDKGEIEAAIKHKLPNLLELEDIKGDLHLHSDYDLEPSHDLGASSMEEMIKIAEELKYEYIGFSEHNPSITKHTKKQIYEILKRRKEHIEQIKLLTKSVQIISLLEVDISPKGSLAIEDKSLSLLDGVIVSIHSSFNQTKEEMTRRVLFALENPHVRILGHPTGRLLNKRQSYNLDWEKIFDFCQRKNKALEINANPLRLDLPDILVREAIKKGVKMVINTDSHALQEMELMRYGVVVARRGWAEKDDILNTLGYNEFYSWFTSTQPKLHFGGCKKEVKK